MQSRVLKGINILLLLDCYVTVESEVIQIAESFPLD
jgi:hypothetical protein